MIQKAIVPPRGITRLIIFVFLLSVISSGCIKKGDLSFKNIKVDNWQPDWALPILNANLTLKNLLKTGSVLTLDSSTGLYSLHYKGTLFTANAADYIVIPDQSFSTPLFTLTSPQTVSSFTGSISDSANNNFTFTDTSGAQLAHVTFKSGAIHMNITSTFRQNVSVQIIFPYINNNGTQLQLNTTINYPNTSASTTINLAGYTIDMTNGGSSKNYIAYKLRFTVNGTGQPLNPGDNISANITMSSIKYSFIDGFMGKFTIPVPYDTIPIAVFNNTLNASIFLRNPSITLSYSNSLGMTVQSDFDHLFGLTNKGQMVNMSIPAVTVNGATTVGQTANTTFVIDSTNSSVQNIFNPAPNNVIYNGRILINPAGSTTYNFITDQSTMSLIADADLPAWFHIITFALQDTVKLILPTDTSLVQKAEFKMLMDNAFPLYGTVQLFFADANYNILDSLVPTTNNIIAEAPVDSTGSVTGRASAITTFVMEHNRYNAMAPNVKYALIRGSLESSGTGDVKILSSNNLIIKLAFRFTLNVSENL